MAFELPKLPYAHDALEPHVDCKNNGNTPWQTPQWIYH